MDQTNQLLTSHNEFTHAHPEQKTHVNGRTWGYVHDGKQGPALVLLPGTLGRGDIFWQQLSELSDQACLLALTYPAVGTIQDWASDIAAILQKFGIKSATVCGSSLGGYVAQYFAAAFPQLTDHLIAANTLSSVAGIGQIPPYSFDLENTPIETLRAAFLDSLEKGRGDSADVNALIDLLLNEVNGRIPEGQLRRRLIALKTAPDLPSIDLKKEQITIIESADDHLISPPLQQIVREVLGTKQVNRFKTGGHFPYVLRPKEYSNILRSCLGLSATPNN